MWGKKGMKVKRYSEEMKTEIRQMVLTGKTQAEIAKHFGLKDRYVVHQILKRERKKEKEQVVPRKKGRPLKTDPTTLASLQAENKRLRMENDSMRAFLEVAERK